MARARGVQAETIVADHLIAKGLEVIGRNVRVGRLEIDLIARDGPVIVVVEVRTRGASSFQRALDSVDARKRARIRAAGERLWQTRFSADPTLERMRFDLASVTFHPDGGAEVEHIRAAF
ncbi:MAG: YraN family protein [Polyangiaceae bacterium]|nr:YraN family protein [Polyangiaceae bacterium]